MLSGPLRVGVQARHREEFGLKGITADVCANYAVTQMWKRKVTIVPTLKMKAAVIAGRLIPTKWYVRIAANQQKKKIYK